MVADVLHFISHIQFAFDNMELQNAYRRMQSFFHSLPHTNITGRKYTVMKSLFHSFIYRNLIVFGSVIMAAYATLLPISSSIELRLVYTRGI